MGRGKSPECLTLCDYYVPVTVLSSVLLLTHLIIIKSYEVGIFIVHVYKR
jgi:hypothetical protein